MAVYILLCSDGTFYTGVTNNLERRFQEHQSGRDEECYTATRRPVKLLFYEWFQDANDAIAFEKQVKGWRRAKKIALIKREWEKLPGLSVAYEKRGKLNCEET